MERASTGDSFASQLIELLRSQAKEIMTIKRGAEVPYRQTDITILLLSLYDTFHFDVDRPDFRGQLARDLCSTGTAIEASRMRAYRDN